VLVFTLKESADPRKNNENELHVFYYSPVTACFDWNHNKMGK
jgi:hypothetical protein